MKRGKLFLGLTLLIILFICSITFAIASIGDAIENIDNYVEQYNSGKITAPKLVVFIDYELNKAYEDLDDSGERSFSESDIENVMDEQPDKKRSRAKFEKIWHTNDFEIALMANEFYRHDRDYYEKRESESEAFYDVFFDVRSSEGFSDSEIDEFKTDVKNFIKDLKKELDSVDSDYQYNSKQMKQLRERFSKLKFIAFQFQTEQEKCVEVMDELFEDERQYKEEIQFNTRLKELNRTDCRWENRCDHVCEPEEFCSDSCYVEEVCDDNCWDDCHREEVCENVCKTVGTGLGAASEPSNNTEDNSNDNTTEDDLENDNTNNNTTSENNDEPDDSDDANSNNNLDENEFPKIEECHRECRQETKCEKRCDTNCHTEPRCETHCETRDRCFDQCFQEEHCNNFTEGELWIEGVCSPQFTDLRINGHGPGLDMFHELNEFDNQMDCTNRIKNHVQIRKAFQDDVDSEFVQWYFEEFIGDDPEKLSNGDSGFRRVLETLTRNEEEISREMHCGEESSSWPEGFDQIDIDYKKKNTHVEVWEKKIPVEGDMKYWTTLYKYTWMPEKNLVKTMIEHQMEKKKDFGPSAKEISEIKADEGKMELISRLAEKHGGSFDVLLQLEDSNGAIVKKYLQINPDVAIQFVDKFEGDEDISVFIDYDVLYNFIRYIKFEIEGDEIRGPYWVNFENDDGGPGKFFSIIGGISKMWREGVKIRPRYAIAKMFFSAKDIMGIMKEGDGNNFDDNNYANEGGTKISGNVVLERER